MSAPHVAGVAALMLESKRTATAPELRGDLLDHALRGVLTLDTPAEAASPNRLVHRDGNRIFFSGFHHDLSRWWSGGDAGALSVCDWTGLVFGGEATALCVDLGGADAWVEDRRPNSEGSYDFYFRFDFSQAQLPSEHVFFEARTSSGLPVLQLRVRKALQLRREAASNTVEIGAFAYDNGGSEVGEWAEHSEQGYVHGSWEAGAAGVFQGYLGISRWGPETELSFPIGDNSSRLIGEVRLGALTVDPGASGTQRFRQFRSWRDRQADINFPSFDP